MIACKPAAYSQWHHVYICLPTALIPVSISVLRKLVVYIPSSLSYIPEYTHPSNTSFSSRILVSVSCLVKPDRFSPGRDVKPSYQCFSGLAHSITFSPGSKGVCTPPVQPSSTLLVRPSFNGSPVLPLGGASHPSI